ncbi:hypothetical protein I3843_09G128200 [Carya illinoinensis]|uniref:Uncharacterized protein n=1 Tax=Carya illinoinensis TaxID=32201 RepID=A0A8T1PHC9_CARIL|nr:hypothetical protein I3760_09G129400 [Carya illinoinensis]KAG6642295.1 hypothetical protein CIPAW_09G132700 [Carya illinoinensis]KAG7963636.1 hypothetical protein I3843_09G128200 [Carya illinoinensis]
MAKTAATSRFLLFFLLLFLTASPKPSHSLSYSQYRIFVSLAQSLTTRVANLRASRGDFTGSRRAKDIAELLERGPGLRLLGFTWSVGWDYVKNKYALREISYDDLYGFVTDANELLRLLEELARTDSGAERAEWVGRNYQNVLGISSSLLKRLLNVFRQSRTWSVGWDYVKNYYAWREVSYDDLYGSVKDANELLRRLGELTRTDSGADRAKWVGRNDQNILGISGSRLKMLLNVFRQSGTLRKVVETVEREIVDGEFLKDCLEVGTNDLEGLLQIFSDLALQFHSSASGNDGRVL